MSELTYEELKKQRDDLLNTLKQIESAAKATVCNIKGVAGRANSAIARAEGES